MASGRPLLLIDGDSLAHRAYHGSRPLRGAEGRPINAMHGFAVMLLALVQTERPRAVLACWDTLDVPTYRRELWPEFLILALLLLVAESILGRWSMNAPAKTAPAPARSA